MNLLTPSIIQLRGDGWIVPSLAAANAATYSQSETTITVSSAAHGIPSTVHNGKKIYLFMGTAATGDTIQSGWFNDFTYVDANTFTCTTSISQAGTGVVNTNTAETTIADLSIELAGNSLGSNGIMEIIKLQSHTGSANIKRSITKLGATSISQITQAGATALSTMGANFLANVNNSAKQVFFPIGGSAYFSTSTSVPTKSTINTAIAQPIVSTLTSTAPNEYIALEYILIKLYRA